MGRRHPVGGADRSHLFYTVSLAYRNNKKNSMPFFFYIKRDVAIERFADRIDEIYGGPVRAHDPAGE